MIPIFKPSYDEEEINALREIFRTGWIGLGPKTKEFEDQFARFIGTSYAIGVNSATAALHLALKLANIQGKEVITTPMTFVSTNHAILYNGGIPVFADIERDTLNVDPDDVKRKITRRTRAIVIVHYGGHACDMESILNLASEYNLIVVEDCAHACGGKYKNQMLGSIGHFGCFSFHAVKNLATGDGGMITTRDREANERLRKLRWLGINRGTWDRSERNVYSWEYNVEEIGFKCHMNDITAAIGLVQLKKLEKANTRRRYLTNRYNKLLSEFDWIETPVEKEYTVSACHNYVIKVRDPKDRSPLMEYLKAKGISTGVHYIPNHLYQMYRPFVKESLRIAESIWKQLITLPLYPDLKEEEQDMIVDSIRSYKNK